MSKLAQVVVRMSVKVAVKAIVLAAVKLPVRQLASNNVQMAAAMLVKDDANTYVLLTA